MVLLKQLLVLLSPFFIFSCHNNQKYPYAIKDFREKLQPCLIAMVEKGIVADDNRALSRLATDTELMRLARSEHPILRAAAFRELLKRKPINHFDLIMQHLDDTALVFTDGGEFGIWDRTVTDDILQEAGWKTQEQMDKTIEQVLTKHNYLRCAYLVLQQQAPQEKYYPFIKDMATRPRRLDPSHDYELGFDDIEYALYGLAKFRKKGDIGIIRQKLLSQVWELTDLSFRLMQEFPDTAYMDVLRAYHRRMFYNFSGNRPHGFTGVVADKAAPEDFIQALVVQENDKSARLLDTMLMRLPLQTCMPDKDNILSEVIVAVWEHPCPAYARLRRKIKRKAEESLAGIEGMTVDNPYLQTDTAEKVFHFLY